MAIDFRRQHWFPTHLLESADESLLASETLDFYYSYAEESDIFCVVARDTTTTTNKKVSWVAASAEFYDYEKRLFRFELTACLKGFDYLAEPLIKSRLDWQYSVWPNALPRKELRYGTDTT